MTDQPKDYRRIYAIGDIHGRADLLDRMAELICHDLGAGPADDCITVTVGDYIDRGADSRGVIERLVRNPFPTRTVALKGNHDELLENFLSDPSVGPHWQKLGGLGTLYSYGVPISSLLSERDCETASAELRSAMPLAHLDFFSTLQTSLDLGAYFLCHAGIRPGIPFEQQSAHDLMWIRNDFLTSSMDFGKRIIHGHTPVEQPEVRPNRINVDTKAWMSGRLICVVLENASHRFLST